MKTTFDSLDFKSIVKLPKFESENEWLAVNGKFKSNN